MKTTNIYLLIDCSHFSAISAGKMQDFILKTARTAKAIPATRLHIVSFNEKARIISPFDKIANFGIPDISSGVRLLDSVISYENKYHKQQTRTVIFWLTSGKVVNGESIDRLYKNPDFNKAIRYVIKYGKPDKYANTAIYSFASNTNGVVDYFSETRLKRLIFQLKHTF